MNDATAQARFAQMVAADKPPTLTADEVADLRARARVVDAGGKHPADAGYVPTFTMRSLYRQAAEAWRVKLSRVAHYHAFGADGENLSRQQVVEHLERQVRRYERLGSGGGMTIDTGPDDVDVQALIFNG